MNDKHSALIYFPSRVEAVSRDEFSDRERDILDQVNTKIAGAETLEDMVDFLFEITRTICPCDRVSIAFVEPDGRVISRYVKAAYEPVLLATGYAEDLQGSSLEAVIKRGTPRIIRDLVAYLDGHPDSRSTKIIVDEGVRSSMTAPLSVDDRNVGLLFRSARWVDAYDERHVRMHQLIAERLGQAVEKAYRIMQLEAANKAYTEMLGFVSHELKSPVASLVTDAQLLVDGYLGDLEDKQRKKIERMIKKGEYLLGLVREYLDLARIEGGELEARFTDIDDFAGEIIEPAMDMVSVQIEDKSMGVDKSMPDHPCSLTCDGDLLRIVLVNLLGNAVKYGHERGLIRITLDCNEDDLTCSVWNEGPGFPSNQRSKLFRKFSRLETAELRKRKGTGVGLYTSWRIIKLHNGRISADAEEGSWAEFRFTIPKNPDEGNRS